MTWEKSASDTLDQLLKVVREPFRSVIKNNAQAHAEKFAVIRKNPHVSSKEAVLGFLRARSHKLTNEGKLILSEYQLTEADFNNYPTTTP
jgi:arginine utilization protein RocB